MSELLKRRKKLTEPEVRFYLLQLTSALAYLHDAQIIHRDLKLGNIFLDSNMRVKVGDFGLATKLAYPEEKKRTVCGTPNYIAPEILQHSGHSFEVDIWSTGIIIYTLLVGKPPYESTDVKATYQRIIENQYSFPPTPTISSEAQHLIKSILQV
jgi:serine/threonine protein kinase